MQVALQEVPEYLRDLTNCSSPYGLSALNDECSILKETQPGSRNDQLNKSTFALAQLVAGGELDGPKVKSELFNIGLQIGLGEKEILGTINSGFDAGMKALRNGETKDLVIKGFDDEVDTWKAFTLADAYKDRPPVEFVLEGLIEIPSLNIFYGAPATLKSFILADLAMCICSGRDWLPPAPWVNMGTPRKTSQGAVLWVDFDNGIRRTHERFKALGNNYQMPEDAPFYYYSMPQPHLIAGTKKSVDALTKRIEEHEGKFIVIDNLGTVTGKSDENSAEMVSVMSNLRLLVEKTNSALVLIHHQRKGSGKIGRIGDRLRGHSSIEASLDLAILVEREENSDYITLRSTKSRGKDVYPFSAAFTFELDSHGNMAKAGFFGLHADYNDTGAEIDQAIFEALDQGEKNKKNLTIAIKQLLPEVGKNRIQDRINRLETTQKIEFLPGNRTEKIYRKLS